MGRTKREATTYKESHFLFVTFAHERMRFLGALAFMSIFGFINSQRPEGYGDFLIQLSFNRQDRDGNGLITGVELKQSLIDNGADEDVGHVEEWMELSDKDGNGGIDLEEYKAFVQSK